MITMSACWEHLLIVEAAPVMSTDARFSLSRAMFHTKQVGSSGAAVRRAPGVEAPDSPSVGAPGLEARVSSSVESRDEEAIAQRYGGPHRSTQRNGVNPAWAEPVLSCPVLSCPVLSCPVLSCLVLSPFVYSCLALLPTAGCYGFLALVQSRARPAAAESTRRLFRKSGVEAPAKPPWGV